MASMKHGIILAILIAHVPKYHCQIESLEEDQHCEASSENLNDA